MKQRDLCRNREFTATTPVGVPLGDDFEKDWFSVAGITKSDSSSTWVHENVSSFCGTRENFSPPMVPAWPLCENSHQLHQSE